MIFFYFKKVYLVDFPFDNLIGYFFPFFLILSKHMLSLSLSQSNSAISENLIKYNKTSATSSEILFLKVFLFNLFVYFMIIIPLKISRSSDASTLIEIAKFFKL